VYAMVPLAPKLPGHVMVVPKRAVANFKELQPAEIFDIGLAVRFLTKELEKFHACTSSTVYIKNFSRTDARTDDRENHMCVHIVARKKGDIANNDDIYPTLERYHIDFSMEYNSTIKNSDMFSDTKISQLGMIAGKYKAIVDKAIQDLKNQSF